MSSWRYDELSRTVFDNETRDPICIVSDLSSIEEMHRRGRLLAHAENLATTLDMVLAVLQREQS